ncbi:hypothetical protein SARC_00187 [Sphaeroforma arctica JP610]|uniref:Uncharacterized protein n=1 Tax=Sphaeroforma arctica JP610 TaxID=667725 RepID=A0A0L0GFR1_9EUKA|nr:hypothetical protein SARC_00187 [Sphaeroforma arctica JP610]KNC87679.1 hypothetical protein SARC_00187 [Sphaeroforma arctica JP610]|eukprot:XP_014161581.1 hypothetical protein SARC_00187 [Sphaeroforma arctica JP610]
MDVDKKPEDMTVEETAPVVKSDKKRFEIKKQFNFESFFLRSVTYCVPLTIQSQLGLSSVIVFMSNSGTQ